MYRTASKWAYREAACDLEGALRRVARRMQNRNNSRHRRICIRWRALCPSQLLVGLDHVERRARQLEPHKTVETAGNKVLKRRFVGRSKK